MINFGLMIPLPSKSDDFLVPALLPHAGVAHAAPAGWPPPDPKSAQLRIFFFLDEQVPEPSKLLWERDDLAHGFLPIGVFHKLCAGALGCAYETSGRFESRLDRQTA